MLNQLKPNKGATHSKMRVGRGPGSGKGKTSGRGMKGQGHRSAGRETPIWFEGGQMPLVRRVPKRGFKNINTKDVTVINVGHLEGFAEGSTVDATELKERGLIRGTASLVKLLGEGEAPKGLTVRLNRVSAGARTKIEAAGGTVELID
jgi:large subunit ribosomal protein L15